MRTTVNLPEGLAENTRKLAAARGVTFSVVVADALRMLTTAGRPQEPARFRLITAHGRLVDPATDLSRTSALIARDDEDKYSRR